MYGSAGRIGVIVPSANTVTEPEFNRLLPPGYNVYASRMWNLRTEVSDLEQMSEHAIRAARELATARVGVIAFACTSGSFLKGPQWEAQLRQRLEDAAGVPVVTTSGALVDALRTLNVRSVAMATPYPDDINSLERSYFEGLGIKVVEIRGLGIVQSVEIGSCTPQQALSLATSLPWQEADGILISCTNFRTIDIIDELEERTQRPVVSSNQATFWASLRKLGFQGPVEGAGRLLRQSVLPAA